MAFSRGGEFVIWHPFPVLARKIADFVCPFLEEGWGYEVV